MKWENVKVPAFHPGAERVLLREAVSRYLGYGDISKKMGADLPEPYVRVMSAIGSEVDQLIREGKLGDAEDMRSVKREDDRRELHNRSELSRKEQKAVAALERTMARLNGDGMKDMAENRQSLEYTFTEDGIRVRLTVRAELEPPETA